MPPKSVRWRRERTAPVVDWEDKTFMYPAGWCKHHSANSIVLSLKDAISLEEVAISQESSFLAQPSRHPTQPQSTHSRLTTLVFHEKPWQIIRLSTLLFLTSSSWSVSLVTIICIHSVYHTGTIMAKADYMGDNGIRINFAYSDRQNFGRTC